LSKFARKVDANQAEIVAALVSAGAMVQSMASVGRGCPDLLVGHNGRWVVMEVKDGTLPASARQLREAQRVWMLTAETHGLPAVVVTDVVSALAAIVK